MSNYRMSVRSLAVGSVAAIVASVLVLTGCSSSSTGAASEASASAAASQVASAITVTDPVTRSTDDMSPVSETSGKLMTGSFMTIANGGAEDVTLVGGTSPVAGKIEIHEVVDDKMQPLPGGLVIPAGGSVKLKMGGYHVMLMDLESPLASGEDVPITLEFDNGDKVEITAPSREIAMDDEQYGPDSM